MFMVPYHSYSVEVYDPLHDVWMVLVPMNGPRAGHSSVVTKRGTILVFGGWTDFKGNGHPNVVKSIDTMEEYNPLTNTWSILNNRLPQPKCGFAHRYLQATDVLLPRNTDCISTI